MKKTILILLVLSSSVYSQNNGIIKGVIRNKNTEQVLSDVTVKAEPSRKTTETDKKGKFQLKNLPITNTTLKIFKYGYQMTTLTINLNKDNRINKEIYLLPSEDVYLDEVIVRTRKRKIEGTKQVLRNKEISHPSTTLFNDTMAALKKMPGVTGNDFSGALYIRGGKPYENTIMMDDIFIIHAYHWDDHVSIFNPAMVDKVDFFTGGFPAVYGMSTSGVVDVKIKNGNFKRTKGFIDLAATGITGEIEAPINLAQQSSFILGARRTHYDLILNLFTDNKNTIYPWFDDAHFKLYSQINSKHSLSYNVFFSSEGMEWELSEEDASDSETVKEGDTFKYGVQDLINSIQWKYSINKNISVKNTFAYQYAEGWANSTGSTPFTNSEAMNIMQYRLDWDLSMNKYNSVSFGYFLFYLNGDNEYIGYTKETKITGEVKTNSNNYTYKGNFAYHALYIQDELEIIRDDFIISVGLRYDTIGLSKENLISPRTGMRKKIIKNTFLNLGWGYFYRYTTSLKRYDKEKGNPDLKAEKATHYIIGVENQIEKNYILKNNLFYKRYSDLIIDDPVKNYINSAEGYAQGYEFILEKKGSGTMNGWISYTYVESKRKIRERSEAYDPYNDDNRIIGQWYYPDFDQRHTISIVVNYKLSSKWSIYSGWDYHSGKPYTEVKDRVKVVNSEGTIKYLPVKGKYNAERYPSYQRLDLKIIYKFLLFKQQAESYIQFVNLYNHQNVSEYYYSDNYANKKAAYDLPFLIIGGIKINF